MAGGAALLASFLALRPSARAVEPPPAVDTTAFIDAGIAGTRRYLSQREAVNDGFTRVGSEFPAMGEHWVSFSRMMDDSLDAGLPSVLIYVNSAAGPRLAGVAYTRLVMGAGSVPAFPSPDAWHEHSGRVADESLPIAHGAHGAQGALPVTGTEDSPRLFILHAWLWTANPEGTFSTDNWTLPLQRAGLPLGDRPGRDAVRGLALGQDQDDYHRMVLNASLALSPGEDSAAATVLHARQAHAARDAAEVQRAARLDQAASAHLAGEWDALWRDLGRALPARAAALRELRGRM